MDLPKRAVGRSVVYYMQLKETIELSSNELCERFDIKRLGLFGSVARGDYTADIDFFVEFDSPSPETMPDRYFGFIRAASSRFGRDIQLLTPRMLRNPHLKRAIEKDLTIIHGS
jgi:predicted nucleotidyltransferase